MRDTSPLLLNTDFPPLKRTALTTLQVNLGYLCNLSCTHCHVNAGPKRTELMDLATIELVLAVLRQKNITVLDLTGGAPEMNPHFRYLVAEASKLGVEVIDRCNLTILLEPGYEGLVQFFTDHKVTVVASLPCYSEKNVSEQRGKGVFELSLDALKILNDKGYGIESSLPLNLVYNPNGAFLPPEQHQLEQEYKLRLSTDFGIEFNQLYTITNMPISRFGAVLLAKGEYDQYMNLLKDNFSPPNLETLMCLNTVSVDWQGNLYDCDFNQMLKIPLVSLRDEKEWSGVIASDGDNFSQTQNSFNDGIKIKRHIRDLLAEDMFGQSIAIGDHCYGCTAGQGSSCGGALNA
ncbi:MAG: arsenosugar biosynthesis radical SAM protein ArsS [Porticoccus sp.]|nr:arsenosugar biosynthesis radical SAM protein ArsS [Porticoccus sp.]